MFLDWTYKRQIIIDNSNNSGSLTDYQVRIDLTSSNFDFTKVNSDGSDIRFTDEDGKTSINFWIENWDSSNEVATIWVKVPSIPASASKDIYMYYGNAGASSVSNGDNTFLFFDDFNSMLVGNKYSENPVLDVVASTWESSKVGDPWVIYDGETYHMWYWGFDGNYAQIGHASSTDGISWTKDSNNPILKVGSSGSYDDLDVHKPSVLEKDGTYYMFYSAQKSGGDRTIALATSTSPTGPWTKYSGNPILSPTEDWEDNFLDTPSVMYDSDEGIWKMWYSGGTISNSEPENWCYATSDDGYNWTKYSGNPIKTPPNDGSWLSKSLGGVDVLKIDDVYHMYYNAFDDNDISRAGHTTSSDGIHWNPRASDLLLDLGSSGSWDDTHVYRPNVQIVDGEKKLWYNAMDSSDNHIERIGLATCELSNILDTSKWKQVNAGGSYSVSGSQIEIKDEGGSSEGSGIRTINHKPPANSIIECLAKGTLMSEDSSGDGQIHWIILSDVNNANVANSNNQHFLFNDKNAGDIRHQSKNSGTWGAEDVVYSSYTPGDWRIGRVVLRETSQDYYDLLPNRTEEGSLLNNADDPQSFAGNYYLGVESREATDYFDWILVRNYTDSEPTTSVGSKEVRKVFTETFGLSANYSRLANFIRILSDNFGVIAIKSKTLSAKRVFTDTFGIADSKIRKFIRVLTDSFGNSDSYARLVRFIRVLTDNFGTADSYARKWTLKRVFVDSFGVADNLTKIVKSVAKFFGKISGVLFSGKIKDEDIKGTIIDKDIKGKIK